jgi:hypothetical protein
MRFLTLFFIAVAFADKVEDLRSHLPEDFYDEVEDEDYEDDDGRGGGVNGGDLDLINEAFANKRLGIDDSTRRFSCHSCEPPDCSHETICHDAIRCYTSHVRDTEGVEKKSKGKSMMDEKQSICDSFLSVILVKNDSKRM